MANAGFVRLNSRFGAGVLDEAPFEAAAGLLYHPERRASGFRAQLCHCNAARVVHGAALSLLADYAMYVIAKGSYDASPSLGGVTATLSTEFMAAARVGQWIEATGELLKDTRELVYVRGKVSADGKLCATFHGLIKKRIEQQSKL